MKNELNVVLDKLKELSAFEVLQYHNKNLLSGDNESRSRYMQNELKWLIDRVEKLEKDQQAEVNSACEMRIGIDKIGGVDFYRKTRQG